MNIYNTLKVGCGKFIYGSGCLNQLEAEIISYGGKPIFIGGPSSLKRVLDVVSKKLAESQIECNIYSHTGYCSKQWAKKYANLANANHNTIIVAVGGGKCIDLAKCVSVYTGLPIITVPTSIATCVATSAVCIMYQDNGIPDGSVAMEKEVDVCIADTSIISDSPKRLTAAGIFDSLAKLPEVCHNTKISNYNDCSLGQYISVGNSKIIYEYLTQEGLSAYEKGTDYPQFDELILTNLLLTSVVSGFSSGSNQLALAHGLYDFMRRNFTLLSAPYLHGEIVAVGILMQHAYNGETEEYIREFREMMKSMGLPVSLSEIGFDKTPESIQLLIDYLIQNTSILGDEGFKLLKSSIEQVL